MSIEHNELIDYISQTKSLVLATVNDKGEPALRSIGSFGTDGIYVYFSTAAVTVKVRQIQLNPNISILFQHENQQFPVYRNVNVSGKAERLTESAEKEAAVKAITARNPAFAARIEQNGLDSFALYRVVPAEVKVLDFSKGFANNVEVRRSLSGT